MDPRPTRPTALMSIRPEFADAIWDGSKQVEFRKRRLAEDPVKVVVYATVPVGAVVGEFDVIDQIVDTPDALWKRFSKVAGIDRAGFEDYYSDSELGVGIEIGRRIRYQKELPLNKVDPGGRPPQSFKYLRD